MTKPVGLTKDVGWQIGVQKTFPIKLEPAWSLITTGEGLAAWLGESIELKWVKGETYRLSDGAVGEVRVFKPNSHLRMTWFPTHWSRASTIQVRVLRKATGTVISFHQENLPGPDEREERRTHYKNAHAEIAHLLTVNDKPNKT